MEQDHRRIRCLHIRSPELALLPARHRLEEAFRLCSLPGLPPNAQLLIRRLELGAIRSDHSPTRIAERISNLTRSQLAGAVCVDQHSAAGAEAVWFSDPLQPFRVLLLRLLDGHQAREWYWRTLFRQSLLSPLLTSPQPLTCNSTTISLLLTQAANSPLRGLAIARLLEAALTPIRLQRLFSYITVALAQQLLALQGVTGTVVEGEGRASEEGKNNAAAAIAAPSLSLAWRHALIMAVALWGTQDMRSRWLAWNALISGQPAWLERSVSLQRIAPQHWLQAWERQAVSSLKHTEVGLGEKTIQLSPLPAVSETKRSLPIKPGPPPESNLALALTPASFPHTTSARPGQHTKTRPEPVEQRPANENAGSSIDTVDVPEHDNQSGADLAVFSAHAGFALLIPLLQRMDFSRLLADNEELLALDLPRRLLHTLAERFAIPATDPVRQLFTGLDAAQTAHIDTLHLPPAWRHMTTSSGRPLHRLDPSESIAIDLQQLLNLLQLLAALLLRRHGRLSLRALIQRPGRVVLTATHWDVIFDLNQIDLRLRRVALDTDPGWVGWLGRVVQFHYHRAGAQHAVNQ